MDLPEKIESETDSGVPIHVTIHKHTPEITAADPSISHRVIKTPTLEPEPWTSDINNKRPLSATSFSPRQPSAALKPMVPDESPVAAPDGASGVSGMPSKHISASLSRSPSPSSQSTDTASDSWNPEQEDEPSSNLTYIERIALVESLVLDTKLSPGQLWYIIPINWWNQFTQGIDADLPPIDTSGLVNERGELTEDSDDFTFVPESAWRLLEKWYQLAEGSFSVQRTAVNTGSKERPNVVIELYPPVIYVHVLTDASAKVHNDGAGNDSAGSISSVTASLSEISSPSASPSSFHLPSVAAATLSITDPLRNLLEFSKQQFDVESLSSIRLWKISSVNFPSIKDIQNISIDLFNRIEKELMEDLSHTLNYVGITTGDHFIAEIAEKPAESKRSRIYLKWPSETTSRGSSPGPSLRASPGPGRFKPKHKIEKGTKGLANLGNSCYMNSALQCLIHVEELANYFLCK